MAEAAGGRLVAAVRHYRDTLAGLAWAQRHGQPVPRGVARLEAIRRARRALWDALAAAEGVPGATPAGGAGAST